MKTYLKDETVNNYQRNLQILATGIYKVNNDLAPEIMEDKFHFVKNSYNLRDNSALKRRCYRLVYLDTDTISSLAPKIWELVPNAIKNAVSLELFKKEIKLWTT